MPGAEDGGELIEVAGRLKQRLVEYYRAAKEGYPKRAEREYRRGRSRDVPMDEVDCADWFIHWYRFRNGDTFIDRFVKANPDLGELERQLLEWWKEPVEGIFEVRRRNGGVLELFNLVDREVYVAASTMGPGVLEQFPLGSFLVTRLDPAGGVYLLSGRQHIYPAEAGAAMEQAAARLAMSSPRMALGRNRERWDRAWALQKELHAAFLERFSSDVVVVPGRAVAETLGSFFEWWNRRVLRRMSPEDRRKRRKEGFCPRMRIPEALSSCETVGLISDPEGGLNLYCEFGEFLRVFADPGSVSPEEHRDIVMQYLWSDSISPLPFRKVVERHPENARLVFGELFKKKPWDNEKDLPTLMRRYKGAFLKRRPRPSFIRLVDDALAGAVK